MNEVAQKYLGRRLSTDEVAQARSDINKAIKELENVSYETGEDYLLLKWGTLKSWDLHSDKAKALLRKYLELGSSLSGISQNDTPEQKDLICQMIDECDGVIQNDWDGEFYTREQAKDYVRSMNS